MPAPPGSFDDLVAEAEAAPIRGWDFGWLAGRATEDRTSWRYAERVAERAAGAERMLDLECGDGRLLAGLPAWPRVVVGAEGHPPDAALAARHLGARGGHAVRIASADVWSRTTDRATPCRGWAGRARRRRRRPSR